jgi:hypothetical protein
VAEAGQIDARAAPGEKIKTSKKASKIDVYFS